MIVVVDASAIVEYLLVTDRSPALRPFVEADDVDLHVPALCDVEVVSALRRAVGLRRMSESRAVEAMDTYLDFPLSRYMHDMFITRMFALRRNFSAYDAAYVTLAEQLNARLLTADDRRAKAVKTHTRISVLP